MQPTNDLRLSGGSVFETHADRLDLRVLLSERSEAADPLRHLSAWQDSCNNADLPDPPVML